MPVWRVTYRTSLGGTRTTAVMADDEDEAREKCDKSNIVDVEPLYWTVTGDDGD